MTIFFTSDLHLYHKNILKFCPDTRTPNMEEDLITSWNKQVRPTDIVWVLGDVGFGANNKITEALHRLNGRLRLIKGNHDHDTQIKQWDRFSNVYDYKELKLNNTKYVLFHYPIKSWNGIRYGSVHLHGHLHGNPSGLTGRTLDVGIDTRAGYKLYTLDEINKELQNENKYGSQRI